MAMGRAIVTSQADGAARFRARPAILMPTGQPERVRAVSDGALGY